MYPGLFYYKGDKLYYHDKSISSGPAENYYIGHHANTNQYSIRVYSNGQGLIIDTKVGFDPNHPLDLEYANAFNHFGLLELTLGERLSDESCLALYEYNIVISSKNSEIHYDRVSIERNHTIKNIIT